MCEALDGRRAIKLYHRPLAGPAADKLRAMVSLETIGLGAQAAWPLALIAGPGGAIAARSDDDRTLILATGLRGGVAPAARESETCAIP